MAKKITKNCIAKNKTIKKAKAKKSTKEESSSLSVMVLAIIGITLLIYFGTSTKLSVDVSIESGNKAVEEIDTSIIISGKKYKSAEEAYEALKLGPQTYQTEDEINFVVSYKGE